MDEKVNINLSEILMELQKIDYTQLLNIVKPIIIYFILNRAVDTGLKTYRLHKDFKAKDVSTMDLPPEIVRVSSEVDEVKLLEQKFGDSIVAFAKTLVEKMPNADLSIFYNNISSLTTSTKNFRAKNIILNSGTQGAYNPKKNDIKLQEHNYMLTIDHELFHVASTHYRESDEMIFSGFAQHTKGKARLANGLNEGYTQLLAERYFGESKELMKAYPYEKYTAEKLEMIIGKDKMESLYLNANLNALVQELSQYEDESTILKFLTDLDFLEKHLGDKRMMPMEKGMINSKLASTNQFLLNCYIKKLNNDFNGYGLANEELKDKLVAFITMMNTTVTVNKREFESIDGEELVKNALASLDSFKNKKMKVEFVTTQPNSDLSIEHQIDTPVSKGK